MVKLIEILLLFQIFAYGVSDITTEPSLNTANFNGGFNATEGPGTGLQTGGFVFTTPSTTTPGFTTPNTETTTESTTEVTTPPPVIRGPCSVFVSVTGDCAAAVFAYLAGV